MAKYKRIRIRRDSKANWEASNPRLALGEMGVDMTELRLKVGNGIDRWKELSYLDKAIYNRLDRDFQAVANQITEILSKIANNKAELQNLIQSTASDLAEDIAANKAEADAAIQQIDEALDTAETALTGRMDSIEEQQATDSAKVEEAVTSFTETATALNQRMDSIVGSATEDTEILDARIDHEGETHVNLGENVRSTQNRISSLIGQIKDEIQPQIDTLSNALILYVAEYAKNLDSLKGQREFDVEDVKRELDALATAGYQIFAALQEEIERRRADNDVIRLSTESAYKALESLVAYDEKEILDYFSRLDAQGFRVLDMLTEAYDRDRQLNRRIQNDNQETQYQLDTICKAIADLCAITDGKANEKGTQKAIAGLTEQVSAIDAHVSDLEEILSKYEDKSPVNWSDAESLQIPEPRLAIVNISGVNAMPNSKAVESKAFMEFWDLQGNYFKKKILLSAQGNSSMQFPKKNFKFDLCNDDWQGDETFNLKIGDWVPQDGFHCKAYYTDFFRGVGAVTYEIYDEILKTRGIFKDRTWKLALVNSDSIRNMAEGFDGESDLTLQLDTGPRCFPAGFPCIVFLNGEFFGIFAWQLKKHRDNMHQTKDVPEHIHLDGTLSQIYFWDGVINWTQFEVRNPKNLYCMDGSKYDGDSPKELIDETSAYYDLDTDSSKVKKQKKATAKVKAYIIRLSQSMAEIKAARATYEADKTDENLAAVKAAFEKYYDVENIIDYQIFCDAVGNFDGVWGKNWQWTTWDGSKWYVNAYDLDCTLGNYPDGTMIYPPLTYHLAPNPDRPMCYCYLYYNDELEARWSELRKAGIITPEHISGLLNDWCSRIGTDNFKAEYKKWPDSPCNSDNVINSTFWKLLRDENDAPVKGSSITYNTETNYAVGDECYYGLNSSMGIYKFQCVQACVNKVPITAFRYRDNIYRVKKWIDKEIQNMDGLYHFKGDEDLSGLNREMDAVQDNLRLVNNILAQAVPDYPDALIVSDQEVEEELDEILDI